MYVIVDGGSIVATMKLTPEKLTAFCAALAETCNVGKACAAVGISRQTAYEWRENDPEFEARWDQAKRVGVTALEDEAHRRAFDGVPEPVVHKGEFSIEWEAARDDMGDVIRDEEGRPKMVPALDADGKPRVKTIQRYSDTLAIFQNVLSSRPSMASMTMTAHDRQMSDRPSGDSTSLRSAVAGSPQ